VAWPLVPVVKLMSFSTAETGDSYSSCLNWSISTSSVVGLPSRLKNVSKCVRNARMVVDVVAVRVKGVLKSRLLTVAV